MDDQTVEELLRISPFKDLDESNFRGKLTPKGILQNDCRLTDYQPGEIVVRRGEWGNSAFFVIEGQLKADLETDSESNDLILKKRKRNRKSIFKSLAQFWNNANETEVRDVSAYTDSTGLKKRGFGKQTRIYLPDLSTVLDDRRTATIHAGQFIGELSALGRTLRAATVVAAQPSRLLKLRWQGLRDLMRGDSKIKNHIDQVFRERALKWFLANTPVFRYLEDDELAQLVEAAQFETYGQYDWAASFKRMASQSSPDQSLENGARRNNEPFEYQEPVEASNLAQIAEEQYEYEKSIKNGWYLKDSDLTLRYRATGHADDFLKGAIELAVELDNDSDKKVELINEFMAQVTSPFVSGRCMKCHTIDRASPRTTVNWFGKRLTKQTKSFTTFKHAPHVMNMSNSECNGCHVLDHSRHRDAQIYRSEFITDRGNLSFDANQFRCDFSSIQKQNCSICHTKKTAGDSCLDCHSYHVR